MALTSAQVGESVFGNKKVTWGKWTGTGTTVEVKTGLTHVEHFALQLAGSAAIAKQGVVNETLPHAGDISVIVDTNAQGYWFAFGV